METTNADSLGNAKVLPNVSSMSTITQLTLGLDGAEVQQDAHLLDLLTSTKKTMRIQLLALRGTKAAITEETSTNGSDYNLEYI